MEDPQIHLHSDVNSRGAFNRIIRKSTSDIQWQQVNLPFKLGGIGLRLSCQTALAAFLPSCYHSKSLMYRPNVRRPIDLNVNLVLPGEEDNANLLSKLLQQYSEEPQIHQSSLDYSS